MRATAPRAVRGWFDHVLHPALFTASQVFFLLPSLFIAAALFWPKPKPSPARASSAELDAFDRRIVTLLAFGPGLAMIALTAMSGRGAVAMWGYPLWLFVGLWIVMAARTVFDAERIERVAAAWATVFVIFIVIFVANYAVLPFIDHRYRAVLFPGDALGADLTRRFRDATGAPLRYVVGTMWDGGNLAHYSPDQPQVLIDGSAARAPWIDLDDLRKQGAVVVWTQGDPTQLPAPFASVAAGADSRRAVRSADAARPGAHSCRLGDPEAAADASDISRAERHRDSPSNDGYATALIAWPTFSKISPICASLTIKGGDSASVSPATRTMTCVVEAALHRLIGAQARAARPRSEIDAAAQPDGADVEHVRHPFSVIAASAKAGSSALARANRSSLR